MLPITINDVDYFNYFGIQLKLDFMGGEADDGTSGASRFLKNMSVEVWDYLKSHFIFSEDKFLLMCQNDNNVVVRYKRALCYQAEYLLISGDSRTNAELQTIMPTIQELAPKAKDIFRMLGLMNRQYPYDIHRRY